MRIIPTTIFLPEPDGTLNWKRVFEITDTDIDRMKQRFLEAPVFEGKTFWQVEKDIAWLDESCPIIKGTPTKIP